MHTYFSDYKTELHHTLDSIDAGTIDKIYERIEEARIHGRQVFVLGNGGSAAAASHWVCDFAKGINTAFSKRLRIMSPGDMGALVTALGNDVSYEASFSEPLRNYLNAGDLVISLSVSGNSGNLVKAHEYARSIGAQTIAIIGDYQGRLAECSDIVLTIASRNYGVVEDIHLVIDHAISQYMYQCNREHAANG